MREVMNQIASVLEHVVRREGRGSCLLPDSTLHSCVLYRRVNCLPF